MKFRLYGFKMERISIVDTMALRKSISTTRFPQKIK